MAWGVPVDVAIFGIVVAAFFVVGLPLITRKVSVPIRVEFEEVPDHGLTPAQSLYFAGFDPKLFDLGYRPTINRRPTNMQGRALIRTYHSNVDAAVVMMNLMTSEIEGSPEQPMNYLEIVTRYGDGTILSTRNAEISEVLEPVPEHIIQERRGIREPEALKAAHDRKAEALLAHGPIYSRPEDFEEAFHEFHQKWCRHQIDRGLLVSRDDDPDRLRPTVKAGLRGIANFLNPLADNFTLARFLVGLVFGLVVPVLTILWLSGPGVFIVTRLAAATGLAPSTCVIACLTVMLTLVGVVVGLTFVTKAFIWCFILTYVILRLVGPTGVGATFALSLWTGIVADWSARRRLRSQKLV
jgi:hypothetical protein